VHVALNLVFLVPGETGGMETYARELIPPLAALGVRLTALVNREAAAAHGPWHDVVPMELVPVRARNRVEWVRGEQQHVPRIAARIGADVVHSLASTAPVWGRGVRVTTVHDLQYLVVPDAHAGLRGLGMRALVPAAVRRSARILADSHATKDDIVAHLGAPPGKIDVIQLGVSDRPRVTPAPERELRAKLGLGERRVLLAVSGKRPPKNLKALLDALAAIPPERRPLLVMPGYATPHEAELRTRAAALRLTADTVFIGWLPAADLEGLYALAAAFVFPSLYEGFGLPVLEAMSRGVPVACSDRSAVPEVAGDAALLFDPTDPRGIAGAVERLLADDRLAAGLRARGLEHVKRFSWERTARETLAAYNRAL